MNEGGRSTTLEGDRLLDSKGGDGARERVVDARQLPSVAGGISPAASCTLRPVNGGTTFTGGLIPSARARIDNRK